MRPPAAMRRVSIPWNNLAFRVPPEPFAVRTSNLWTFLLLLPALAACQRHDAPPPAREPHAVAGAVPTRYASEEAEFTVTEVVAGLEHPWSLAFLPDGDMLVTERPGRLRRIG